jgi:hypothetical protein
MVALRVDYAKLDTLSESLRRVAEGLEHIRADCEVTGRGWGGTTVRGSMDDFTGNWDAHRENVTAAVQELAAACHGGRREHRRPGAGMGRALRRRHDHVPLGGTEK